ncbi:hypothetical protein ASPWEDRAFT_36358 [Aspergillus wentii DTO 134E9]|uniref:Uncharacterized protein n=1 Tax=Aspergillus wentii DTO 134E9 TaxID=1073089 RepID=A0A1L9RUX8_ASPWE|nr:uncharacterized protein ASPWEDRAFT_36358 [Aspergillus wentii DTO 134E9]OJJ38667.1 hypothetical protein ASPWEDRAFT_36358 [Aspergillus wentii DTO 134E9]
MALSLSVLGALLGFTWLHLASLSDGFHLDQDICWVMLFYHPVRRRLPLHTRERMPLPLLEAGRQSLPLALP